MKKQGIILLVIILLLLASCTGVVVAQVHKTVNGKENETPLETVRTFAEWTTNKVIEDVPAMITEQGKIGEVCTDGGSCVFVDINGSTVKDYKNYLGLLEQEGYKKHVDNGEEGLEGSVLTSVYTKDDLTVTVMHMKKLEKTYVAAEKIELSEHLFYSEEYIADNKAGAKTSLHMLELQFSGNCFILQLKNGHFIVMDGGNTQDAEYLLNYLESLTPKGEKPVVEGWFISHNHIDHIGIFKEFVSKPGYLDRILVNGIYMDVVSSSVATEAGDNAMAGLIMSIRTATKDLKTSTGESTPVYRPHAGQTYYFNDIKIDVMQTMLQVPSENYYHGWTGNYNEKSVWLMCHIDGQKFLHAGDADFGAMKTIMATYNKECFEMDIMAVQHHGINVHNDFSDFIKVKTLLYPYFTTLGHFKADASWGGSFQVSVDRNEYLHEYVEEALSYGDGGKVLTFPYTVGKYKNVPLRPDRVKFEDVQDSQYYIPF